MEEKNPTVNPRILIVLNSLFRLSDRKKSLNEVNMDVKLGFQKLLVHKECQKLQSAIYQALISFS